MSLPPAYFCSLACEPPPPVKNEGRKREKERQREGEGKRRREMRSFVASSRERVRRPGPLLLSPRFLDATRYTYSIKDICPSSIHSPRREDVVEISRVTVRLTAILTVGGYADESVVGYRPVELSPTQRTYQSRHIQTSEGHLREDKRMRYTFRRRFFGVCVLFGTFA